VPERIFGVSGRNAGALSFLLLLLILKIGNSLASVIQPGQVVAVVKVSSVLVTVYFCFQLLGIDKAKWVDVES
jgi:hypothetical protein